VTRTPLWSAEHLTRDRLEGAEALKRPRGNAFHAEPRLSKSERAELKDYARSGYDRGHMSPNGDMSTPKAQHESFSLANMVPQHPCNNEVVWEGIESAVRDLAAKEGELYVVTGPVFRGATLKALNSRVLVPSDVFKAVYDPKRNEAGVYLAPNDASLTWRTLSLDQLRDLIGIDVFPSLANPVKTRAMTLPTPPVHNECRVSR
jgi:endonuclease G